MAMMFTILTLKLRSFVKIDIKHRCEEGTNETCLADLNESTKRCQQDRQSTKIKQIASHFDPRGRNEGNE
jgi:hypothetical protein